MIIRNPLSVLLVLLAVNLVFASKPRLIVLADMGNEPDEEQQIVHLLLYANEFDIEGLIAVTGKYLPKSPQPELFFDLIESYDQVVENLRLHASGWPEAGDLQAVVAAGQHRYGIADVRPGRSTNGSRLIERSLLKEDPRPLHVIVNAGSNTLAQALVDLESKSSPDTFESLLLKLRVFENGAQDNAGAWILNRWPSINWIRSNYQTYCYGGPAWDGAIDGSGDRDQIGPHTWKPYEYSAMGQHHWALDHLKGDHGRLLAKWPLRQFAHGKINYLEGGGTVPFLRLINNGLQDPQHHHWGGWGGRYNETRSKNVWSKHQDIRADEKQYGDFYLFDEANDTWTDHSFDPPKEYDDSPFTPVWRWRADFFSDFAARADWCIMGFEDANHAPQIVLNEDPEVTIHRVSAEAGTTLSFDASQSTDPDGDELVFNWWIYKEPSTYRGDTETIIDTPSQPSCSLTLPADGAGKDLHLVLAVRDQSEIHPMTSYRRVIVSMK